MEESLRLLFLLHEESQKTQSGGHGICREVLLGDENCEDYITQPYWQQVYE
jgi:hypothetical protein